MRDDHPNNVEMGQVVHHLIEAQGDPESRAMDIVEAPEIPRPGFDPIHDEMDDEIDDRQIPKRGNRQKTNRQR